jgi:2-keto-4-pentenoate hydratase/2-oxohepta-3-ene-1,7-dioic acid hydratase in catechol pathway
VRLVSYAKGGQARFGVAKDGGVVDVSSRLSSIPNLAGWLAADLEGAAAISRESPDHALEEVEFLPVIPEPSKVVCVLRNYRENDAEERPAFPALFSRFADSQVGHLQPIVRPAACSSLDYEGELAVVIGKPGRHIDESIALDHVAGYSCYNDASVRLWQRHTAHVLPGKNFHGTGGFGPWLVSADEITDPAGLTLVTRLNGQEMQRASTSQMFFSIPELVRYVSTFTPLRVGDVIVTGTPGGVGFRRDPPLFLRAGDRIEVEIEGIGTLVNPVVEEQ